MKHIIALLLALCLFIGVIPAANAFPFREPVSFSEDLCCQTLSDRALDADYVRPDFDGYLIEVTPQRVADTFAYLDEMYIEKHPEAALIYNIANEEDRSYLSHLAQVITEGCTTNTQKADAIDDWLRANIAYEINASAYANDTFYNRIGNCLSYANTMQALLRSLGIPAVVGDGWRGDMKTSTVDLFNYDGHAWCFVYLEGQWVLYDPLWLDGGTTDRDYMAEWIYFDTVEFVTPAYDGNNLPPEAYNKPKVYYTDGVLYNYNVGADTGYGNFTQFVNNQGYNFTTNQCEENGALDGWYILDETKDKNQMVQGEVYRDSWISYGDYRTGDHLVLTYAHPNGMQIDGAVMEYDGAERYMCCNTSFPILADEEDYSIQYGTFALDVGYRGVFFDNPWGENWQDGYNITIKSDDNSIASINQDGTITCHKPGFIMLEMKLEGQDWDGSTVLYSITYANLYVSGENRVPSYAASHTHQYKTVVTAPTCTEEGYTTHRCTICSCFYTDNYTAPWAIAGTV